MKRLHAFLLASIILFSPTFARATDFGNVNVLGDLTTKKTPVVDVRAFGAVGNGTTDDTSAIQAAITSLTTGGVVFFPSGTYKITDKLTLGAGITILGASQNNTVIKSYTDGTDCLYALNKKFIVVKDIQLYDAIYNTTRTTGYAINFDGTGGYSRFNLENVYLIGFQDGLHATLVGYSSARNVRAVFQKRDSFSWTGVTSTAMAFYETYSSGVGRYNYYSTNGYDSVFNSAIGDNPTSDSFHFEDCTNYVFNCASAENDSGLGTGNGYYLKNCTNFTFNSSRTSKVGITNGFYFEAATRYITINTPYISTITGYGFYLDDSVSSPLAITVNNPLVDTAASGYVRTASGGRIKITFGNGIVALANSATPSVWGGQQFLTGGTTTITNFTNGYVGQTINIISEHAVTVTDGTNIFLSGATNWTMAAKDSLTLTKKQDGKWYEVARSQIAGSGGGSVSDDVYGANWDTRTTTAPSMNAVYDKIQTLGGGHDPVTVTNTPDIQLLINATQSLNGTINWVRVITQTNWNALNAGQLQGSATNWSSVNQLIQSGAINWSSLNAAIQALNINWSDLNGILNAPTINWTDVNLGQYLSNGGINWTNVNQSTEILDPKIVNWAKARSTTTLPINGVAYGDILAFTAGENLTFGQLVFYNTDGKMWLTNATAIGTMGSPQGIALAAVNADASVNVLLGGVVNWSGFTFTGNWGKDVFASAATKGAVTLTAPTTADSVIKKIGEALSDTILKVDVSEMNLIHN